jgi:hypothetical protein
VIWEYLADSVVILHYAFVAFVTGGAILLFRWRWVIWLHLPALIWGACVEFIHWRCPLEFAEHWVDIHGHIKPYTGDFIQHHMFPFLYGALMAVRTHILLGALLLVLNAIIYGIWLKKTGLLRKA